MPHCYGNSQATLSDNFRDNSLILLLHYTRLMASFPGQPGKPVPERYLREARSDGVLRCSGISWTSCKQSAHRSRQNDRKPHQHLISQFLKARCSYGRPTNSVRALNDNSFNILTNTMTYKLKFSVCFWLKIKPEEQVNQTYRG